MLTKALSVKTDFISFFGALNDDRGRFTRAISATVRLREVLQGWKHLL
jgi:hypothetical protein